jgi:DNA modification methylase
VTVPLLLQGECLDRMKEIPSGSVDMVLCDLPYGTTQNKWDSVIPLEPLWKEYLRVCRKSAAMVFTAQTPFDKTLGASAIDILRYEWIWRKNVASGHLNAKIAPMKEHENILVFYTTPPTYNPQMTVGKAYRMKRRPINDNGSNYGNITRTDTVNEGTRYPKTVLEFDRETGLHPTQKPVALMEYLVRTYTDEGDVVLDNTMGSGTTGVACMNSGRRFIGIERDPAYFDAAQRRIAAALAPTDLFFS